MIGRVAPCHTMEHTPKCRSALSGSCCWPAPHRPPWGEGLGRVARHAEQLTDHGKLVIEGSGDPFFSRGIMSDLQVTLTLLAFAGVILAIAFNLIDMAVAALLGVSIMLLFGVFTRQEFLNAAQTAGGSIALLFGGMVVARTLVPAFADWPAVTLPVFVAMMFGGTLGGNATLIGASANIVSAGISAAHGKPISFGTFARYGVPLTLCQIILSAIYILVLHSMIGR